MIDAPLTTLAEEDDDLLRVQQLFQERANRRASRDPRSAFRRGMAAGVDDFQAGLYGVAALAGDVIGSEAVTDFGLDGYQRNTDQANEEVRGLAADIRDIDGDVGRLGEFLAVNIARMVPELAAAATGAGVAGIAAKRLTKEAASTLLKNQIDKRAAKLMVGGVSRTRAEQLATKALANSLGKAAGVAGGTAVMADVMSGRMAGNLHEETGEVHSLEATVSGTAQGMLEAAPFMRLAHRFGGQELAEEAMTGIKNRAIHIAKRAVVESLDNAVTEGITETMQSVIERATVDYVTGNEHLFSEEHLEEMVAAGLSGALIGGVFGVGTGSASGAMSRTDQSSAARRRVESFETELAEAATDETYDIQAFERQRKDAEDFIENRKAQVISAAESLYVGGDTEALVSARTELAALDKSLSEFRQLSRVKEYQVQGSQQKENEGQNKEPDIDVGAAPAKKEASKPKPKKASKPEPAPKQEGDDAPAEVAELQETQPQQPDDIVSADGAPFRKYRVAQRKQKDDQEIVRVPDGFVLRPSKAEPAPAAKEKPEKKPADDWKSRLGRPAGVRTPEQIKAAKRSTDAKKRVQANREINVDDDNILQAVAKLGGLDTAIENDLDGRLPKIKTAFGVTNLDRPGKGLTLDELGERLLPYGYLPESNVGNGVDSRVLLDLLERAASGEDIRSRHMDAEKYMEAQAREDAEAEQAYNDQMAEEFLSLNPEFENSYLEQQESDSLPPEYYAEGLDQEAKRLTELVDDLDRIGVDRQQVAATIESMAQADQSTPEIMRELFAQLESQRERASNESSAASEGALLESYSQEEITEREQQERERGQKESASRADQEKSVNDFKLTGSDRSADVANAQGQKSLLDSADNTPSRRDWNFYGADDFQEVLKEEPNELLQELKLRERDFENQIDDWQSRVYKETNATYEGRDEEGEFSGSKSISAANERRRERVIGQLEYQLKDVKEFIQITEDHIASIEQPQPENSSVVDGADIDFTSIFDNPEAVNDEDALDQVAFSRSKTKSGDRDLITLHNLSEENLRHAEKMGGLAVPSLAVTKVSNNFDSFGEISLVADPSILFDKDANTFNADIYTARYPSVKYKPADLSKAMDGFKHSKTWEVADRIEDDGLKRLDSLGGLALDYFDQIGKPVKTIYKKNKAPAEFRKYWGKMVPDLLGDTEFVNKIHAHLLSKITAEAKQISTSGNLKERELDFSEWFDVLGGKELGDKPEDMKMHRGVVGNLVSRISKASTKPKKDIRSMESEALRKVRKSPKTRSEYNQWIEQTFKDSIVSEKIAAGETRSGERRYVPHTLNNLVKEMTKSLVGGEGFNYGAGSIRSGAAKRFKSLDDIKQDRDSIISSEDLKPIKEEVNNELIELSESLKPYYKYETGSFSYLDAVAENLYEQARRNMRGTMQDFNNVPKDLMKSVNDYLLKLRYLPTEYFESKIQRAVDISEFTGAVVPAGTSKEITDLLKSKGLTVKKIRSNYSRQQALESFDAAVFSRPAEPAKQSGTTPAKAAKVVNRIKRKWNNAPNIEVVESISDVPYLREENRNDNKIKAVYRNENKTVYIVAGAHKNDAEIEATLLHEVQHFANRETYGKEAMARMKEVGRAIQKAGGIQKYIADNGIDYDYNWYDQQFTEAGMNEGQRLGKHVDELLADMASKGTTGIKSAARRAIAAIRRWLRSMGFNLTQSLPNDALVKMLNETQKVLSGKADPSFRMVRQPVQESTWHGNPDAMAADSFSRQSVQAATTRQINKANSGIRRWVRRNLTKEGLMNDGAFRLKIQSDQMKNLGESEIAAVTHDFEKALKNAYGKRYNAIDKATLEEVNDYLGSTPEQRSASNLPAEVKDVADAMRSYLDRMSGEMIRSIDEIIQLQIARGESPQSNLNLIEKIQGNIGHYLNRSYAAFNDPDWKDKALDNADLISRAEAFIAQNNPALSPDEVTGAVRAILQNAADSGNFMTMISKGTKQGSKDVSITRKRKDVPEVIRELLGEYKDPKLNFASSASKMQWYAANHHFLMNLRQQGDGVFLFDKPTGEFDKKIAGDDSQTMNPLNGMYTTVDFEQGMQDAVNSFDGSDFMRRLIGLNSMVKYGKTILSPTTQFRNFQSAAMFTIMNGHFDWTKLGMAKKATWADLVTKDDQWRDYTNKLIGLGVLHDNPYASELRLAMQDFADMDTYAQGPKQGLKRFGRKMADIYGAGDNFWKVVGFENEKQNLMKSGMPEVEAEDMAATRIRNGYPTYSMVPRAVKKLRIWPLIGTFVSFPYEAIRTSYNQIGFMRDDMAAGRNDMAAKRMIGMALASASSFAIAKVSMMMIGISEEDDEAIHNQMPPWSRNSQLMYTGVDENGSPQYMDLSYLDPYTYLKKPISALLNGNNQGIDKKLKDAAIEIASPFVGPDIAASAVGEIVFNKRLGGGDVYNEQDTAGRQAAAILNHAWKATRPGVFNNLERTALAIQGDVSRSGVQYSLGQEALGFVGHRVTTLNTRQSIIYKSYEFNDAIRDATSILSRKAGQQNKISDKEIEAAYESMVKARERAFKNMSKLISGAQKLGVPNDEIKLLLKTARISGANQAALFNNKTPEWEMSKRFAKAAEQRAILTAMDKQRKNEIEQMIQKRKSIIRRLQAANNNEIVNANR